MGETAVTDSVLVLSGIYKKYYDSVALDGISLEIQSGELCAILGENGAGKTSLMNVVAGESIPDAGHIVIRGERVKLKDARDALKHGIGMIPQEPQLVESLTIDQTIFLGREPTRRWVPLVDKEAQVQDTLKVLSYLEWDVHPSTRISDLSLLEKKLVLLARLLQLECKILILDEITAGLSNVEMERVLRLIERIHRSGVTVVFITCKVEQVLSMATHAVVLRNGRVIADVRPMDRLPASILTASMVGEGKGNRYPRTYAEKGKALLIARDVCSRDGSVNGLDLVVREGEIIGIVALENGAKKAIKRLLLMEESPAQGLIRIEGTARSLRGLYQTNRAGLAYLSGECSENLFEERDAEFNMSVASLNHVSKGCFVFPGAIRQYAVKSLMMLNMRFASSGRSVRVLSYGMQKQLALLRIICSDKKVMILEDPTAGVDSASKVELYNIMNLLAHRGKGIILLSTDMQEISGMCDQIYVNIAGKGMFKFLHGQVTPEALLHAAIDNG